MLGKEPKFQEFKNLRSLLLDRCDLSDDFKTLVFFLRGSPMLEKLTLRRCEVYCCLVFNLIDEHSALSYIFSAGYSSQNVLAKRNECPYATVSHLLSFVDLICCVRTSRLKSYNDGHGPHLIRLLQHVSVNLSKNNIKLTKVN